jgi:hypothetical protein
MSSEKHDMSLQRNDIPCPDGAEATAHAPGGAVVAAPVVAAPRLRIAEPTELPLRCVWTDHLDNRSRPRCCNARIPARTVAAAWRGELALGRTQAGFFHFVWRGRVGLGYGLPDGTVRGVYCPAHRAEREERLGYDPELVLPAQPASTIVPVAAG